MPLRTRRALLVTCVAVIVAVLVSAAPASAHAELVSSTPSDAAILTAEPARITLTFSEEIDLRLSAVKIVGPDGRRLDTGALTAGPTGEDSLTTAVAPDTHQGTFSTLWQVTASDDGHTTSGHLTFSVGAPSKPATTTALSRNQLTSALSDAAQWTGFVALALIGGFTTLRTQQDDPHDPPTWPVTLGWGALLIATVLQLLVYGPAARGLSPSHLFDRSLLAATLATRDGHALMARLALLAVAAVLGDAVIRRARSPLIPLVFTVAVAATWGTVGHAATGGGTLLAMASLTLHVTAMALWVGGLAAVVLLLLTGSGATVGATAARFSRMAVVAVAVIAATGCYQAWREIGGISALIDTTYGRLLLAKVVLLLAVLGLATRSRGLVTRWREGNEAALRGSVLIELAGAAALLVLAVLLSGNAPPRS